MTEPLKGGLGHKEGNVSIHGLLGLWIVVLVLFVGVVLLRDARTARRGDTDRTQP